VRIGGGQQFGYQRRVECDKCRMRQQLDILRVTMLYRNSVLPLYVRIGTIW
jgi:hypothetical protein